jgi:hypothetical protein
VPFINPVFDKLTGNVAWSILSIGKYNLSLRIPFAYTVSNIVLSD